jgi:dimethylargininase
MIFEFDSALVREPAHSVIHGLTSQSGPPPSYDGVTREHAQYVQALRDCGLAVEVLPALEGFPDSVFVEDPALVFGDTAILLRPGAPTRLGEVVGIEPALRRRFRTVLKIETGYADGGDILRIPAGVLIGLSSRTDRTGAAELSRLLAQIGLDSWVVQTPADTLHLKSDCSLLAGDHVLCTAGLARSGIFEGFRSLVVPESERRATNALRLNDSILLGDNFPLTAELVRREGYDVRTLPVREIGRIDAGLSCMSLRWKASADSPPGVTERSEFG